MKVAVSSQGQTLDDQIDPRFGRCAYFIFVDSETMEFEAVENPNLGLGQGAGIQSARLVLDKGVSAVITGNLGPNSFDVFKSSDITIITGAFGKVRDAITKFKSGELKQSDAPTVEPGFGPRGSGPGGGRGMGGGRGRGGGGRGGGRGRNRSQDTY